LSAFTAEVVVKVIVVYKWARDPEDAAVRNDGSVDWRGSRMAVGEDDHAAVAVGLALADASGGSAAGVTLGDGDATWAMARGLEEVVALADAPILVDNAATAALLAAVIRWVGAVDVVVIGDAEPYPGVPAALAGVLGWPALLGVSTATCAAGRVLATRRLGDREQTMSLGLPAVLAVAAASAEKQAPGMKEILAARKRPIRVVSMADLALARDDRLRSRGTRVPEVGPARIFRGSPASATGRLVAALREDGVL
jgi:electron transfer flavoprotein beta subunit